MKKFQVLTVIAVLLAGFGLLPVSAQATDYTWQGGVSTNWSDPGNWTSIPPGTAGPPNATTATAWVDNNIALNVTVYLNGNYTVNQLKIDAGDAVYLNNGQYFYLGGTSPVLDVAGTFTLGSSGSTTSLHAYTPATLRGGGTLVLGGSTVNNNIQGAAFTNNSGNTIQGQGQISAPLFNYGAVTATGLGLTLSGTPIINTGTMTANGGPLKFSGTTIANNNLIKNNAGTDTLSFSSSTVSGTGKIDPNGGTLTWTSSTLKDHQLGAGQMQISGTNYFYGKNTLDSATHINMANGTTLTFYNNGTSLATLSGGDVTLASTGSNTYFSAGHALSLQSNLILGGTSASNYVTGNTITLEAGHTIQGQGHIQAPLVNNGTVTAQGGTLNLDSINITNNNIIQNNAATDTLAFNNATISGTGQINPELGAVQFNSSKLYDHQVGAGTVRMSSGTNIFYGKNTLDSATHINMANGTTLTLYNNGSTDPATLIGGDVTLASTGSSTYFYAGHALSLQSNLILGGTSASNYVTGNTITLAAGHTIQGQGHIQAPLVNNGTITAQGGTLNFDNIGITDNNTIQNNAATDTLAFNSATISGTGQINPGLGKVQLNSSTLYDYQVGAGTVQMSGGSNYFYGKNTLDSATHINMATGTTLTLYNNGSTDPATLIGGDLTLASTGSSTYFSAGHALSLQSNLILGGTSTNNYVTGNTITLAAGHSIQGQGQITAPLVNYGGVTATGLGLTLSGNIDNEAPMTANGGPLKFSSSTITNNNTIKNYADTDTLSFSSSTVSGTGQIDPKGGLMLWTASTLKDHQLGAGQVQMSGYNYFYGKNTLSSGTHITLGDNSSLYFHNNGSSLAALSGGDVTLASTDHTTTFYATNALSLQSNLVLAGTSANNIVSGSTITLAAGKTIQGQGQITAPLNNYGAVTATGLGLTLSGTIDNEGPMTGPLQFSGGTITNNNLIQKNVIGDTLSFSSSTVSGTGQIDPKGGLMLWTSSTLKDHQVGAGQVQMSGYNYFYGKNTLNSGTHITLADNSYLYFYNNGTSLATLSGGDVTLASTDHTTTFYAANALSLQSNLYLNGVSDSVGGTTITLAAGKTIQGQGQITAPLNNYGAVTATGLGLSLSSGSIDNEGPMTGPLQFSSDTITNNNLIQKNAIGDTLSFTSSTVSSTSGTGKIDPKGGLMLWTSSTLKDHQLGAGQVQMSGYNYFYGKNTLNSGTHITLADNSYLYFYNNGSNLATLSGGDVTLDSTSHNTTFWAANALSLQSNLYLNGVSDSVGGTTITLAAGKTIQGHGQISAPIVNHGTIAAQGGTLTITGTVSGDGTVAITGSTLDLRASLTTGNLTMAQPGNLIVANNLTVTLSKDFVFAQTNPSNWNWGTGTTLAMNGGGGGGGGGYGQRLEIGGKDYGADSAGFASNANFNLVKLSIGDTNPNTQTVTFLSDWVNNGQRNGTGGQAEALYVGTLFVGSGDTLNLDGLHLYTMHNGIHLVTLGDSGASWLGGGTIINEAVPAPVPLPSSLLLLGSGLLGLGGRRWRRRNS